MADDNITAVRYDFPNTKRGDDYRGDTFLITNTTTGDPIDMTGQELRIAWRKSATATPAKSISIGSGITHLGTNQVRIDAFTVELEPREYLVDWHFVLDGVNQTLVYGTHLITPDVTP